MHARTVDLIFDPTISRLSEIAVLLHRIGYQVSPLSDDEGSDSRLNENRRMLVDVAIAGFCAANAMWVAIALYAGQFSGQ